jgi:hypothetical protein
MSRRYLIQQMAAWLAVAGFCLPQAALAAGPTGEPSPMILDVALQNNGTLVGQVLDAQGGPVARLAVSLRSATSELAAGQTNEQGYFAFSGLTSGTYQVTTPAGASVCRAWSRATAPPAARPALLMVADGSTVRGECCTFLGTRPWLVAGLIASAIAIPIAVGTYNRPTSP